MKIKVLAIILAIVVVVGGGAAAGVLVVNNQPEKVAVNAIKGLFEDLPKRQEFAGLSNMLKEGSLEFSASSIEADGISVMEDFSTSGKLYFGDKELMLEDLSFEFGDHKIALDAYASEDTFYISENEILDVMIGFVKGEMTEEFEDSIFAYGSGSEFELDEYTTDIITALLTAADEIDSEELRKDATDLLENYFEEFYKIFCENVDFESESDEVRIGGEKTNVRVITVTIDAEGLADTIDEFYDFLCKDDQMVDFLDKWEDSFIGMAEVYMGEEFNDSVADMYEELLEEAEEYVDVIVTSAAKAGDEEVVIEICTPKLSSTLLKLAVKYEKTTLFTLDCGEKGIAKSDKISLTAGGSTITYEVKENSSDKFEAVLSADKNEIASIKINNKKDSYTLNFGDYVVVTGDWETSGKETTITIDDISVGEFTTISTDITITINQKDKMPAPEDDFDRISDITEDDIMGWAEALGEEFGDIFGATSEEDPYEDYVW